MDPNEPPRHMIIGLSPLPPPELIKNLPKGTKLPTREEFLSGDVTTVVSATGTYRDVFGKVHAVADCAAHFLGSKGAFISCFSSNRHYDNQD